MIGVFFHNVCYKNNNNNNSKIILIFFTTTRDSEVTNGRLTRKMSQDFQCFNDSNLSNLSNFLMFSMDKHIIMTFIKFLIL